jgi:hypothetical protein
MPLTNITQSQVNEWIAALRSGDYKQTNGMLVAPIGGGEVAHCCLGVYGVLNGYKVVDDGLYDDSATCPVNAFVSEKLMSFNAQSFFSSLNDTYSLSFKQIAHIAEDLPIEAYEDNGWWTAPLNSERIAGMRAVLAAMRH